MSRPRAFETSGEQTAPASQEHRQELRGKAELLRRWIDAATATDGERITAITAFRNRNGGGVECVRQPFCASRDGQNGRADRGERKADADLVAQRRGPRAARQYGDTRADCAA